MGSDSTSSDPKSIFADSIAVAVDKKLGRLLTTVVNEVNAYAMHQIRHIKKLSEIGIALSIEKDINKIFEMILEEASSFCGAEAGTLYIVVDDGQSLKFEVSRNTAINIRMGGVKGESIQLPNVPLYVDGRPNYANVSSYAALTGKILNIPDIYDVKGVPEFSGLDFTGSREYDRKTGYRTLSMLVIPMRNHEDETIGVLQLINARDEDTGKITAFSAEYVDIISSLASQAAVALTNVQLIAELRNLFYSFIESIAAAIDEKSAYTGGHIRHVVTLTMMIARAINDANQGPFAEVHFNEDQMEELRIAAWMHDVGKITTPEHLVDKATKLETVFDRLHLVETRFHLLQVQEKNRCLERKLDLIQSGRAGKDRLEKLEDDLKERILQMKDDFEFIKSCNNTGDFMADKNIERLNTIGRQTYEVDGKMFPLLTEDEIKNLGIRKGTLTDEERKLIENHAKFTFEITSKMLFPKTLSMVPALAAAHHEKLDGSGYPYGLKKENLPLQARILAVADIFEALTAKDRPYKTPMSLSTAIKILGAMEKDGHVDADVLDIFIRSGQALNYALEKMDPEQIDIQLK